MELTRMEIEQRLEQGLVGKMIKFRDIRNVDITAKLQRLSVRLEKGEVLIAFMLGGTVMNRYEVDIRYFNENIEILYGDTYTGERRDIRRILTE